MLDWTELEIEFEWGEEVYTVFLEVVYTLSDFHQASGFEDAYGGELDVELISIRSALVGPDQIEIPEDERLKLQEALREDGVALARIERAIGMEIEY